MKVFKKLAVLALVLTMIAGLFPARGAQAATKKPAKAKVTANANDDGTSVTLTIAKTKNAQGYKIMVKKPGAKKFTKLVTIKEDGTAKRTYTATKLAEGEYQFKVRAYLKNGKKTVWGKYSKVAKVTVKAAEEDYEATVKLDPQIEAALDEYYPKMKKLAETGKIEVFADPEIDEHEYITFGKWNYDRRKWTFFPEAAAAGSEYQTDKEATPIEWMILEYSADGKSALVLSRFILTHANYNDGIKSVTWETCTSRKWLNDEFFNKAFTDAEKEMIKLTTVHTDDNQETGAKGGNDTEDKLFFLSAEEANKYFPDCSWKGNMKNAATDINGEIANWYLRTPGENNEYISGFNGFGQGVFPYFSVFQDELMVRPACWITLTPEMIAENNLSLGKEKKEEKTALGKDDIYVKFGTYGFTADRKNESLEWKILSYDEKNNKILLITKPAIFSSGFNEYNYSGAQDLTVIWENCTLREYLNGNFYQKSFTDEDKKIIIKSVLENKGNDNFGRKGGGNTEDYVFLLSIEEAEEYFGYSRWALAKNRIATSFDGVVATWFLRSPGDTTNTAAFVGEEGTCGGDPYRDISGCDIRPAIWIDLNP